MYRPGGEENSRLNFRRWEAPALDSSRAKLRALALYGALG
jgi:hypothetical protein